ncbi:hypothetical protein M3Y98_00320100 [Aphelenchoides besseyi]|nr:hypothetical protein M3Y98_00320100 [Aphelenchoides besseyi]KAI6201399.1 hypothetical protein M3Y96_00837700 [Aphelenchoides besseyi]
MLPRSQVLTPNSINHVATWLIRKVDRKAMIGKQMSLKNAIRCMDLVEDSYCHDSLALSNVLVDVQRRLNPTACPDMNSIRIPTDDYVLNAHIITPTIDMLSLYDELKN